MQGRYDLTFSFTSLEVDGIEHSLRGARMTSVQVIYSKCVRAEAARAMQALCLCLGVFLICVPLFSQGSQGRILERLRTKRRRNFDCDGDGARRGTRQFANSHHG